MSIQKKVMTSEVVRKKLLDKIVPFFYLFFLGGVFGFVYEEIFYYFDLGKLVKRGTTFGPWIPIYGFGAIFMLYLVRFCKKPARPLKIFVMSAVSCGLLELFTGVVALYVFHTRLWDYNVEILNWGNIGGFICFRSVVFFACSGMALAYIVSPAVEWFSKKVPAKVYRTIGCAAAGIFALDIAASMIYRLFFKG